MKKNIVFCLIFLFAVVNIQAKEKLKAKSDSLSYCIGISMGNSYNQNKIEDFNPEAFFEAFKVTVQAKDSTLKTEWTLMEAEQMLRNYFQEKNKELAKATLVKGLEFLEQNKKRDSIYTLESGLQYEVIYQGSGAIPKLENKVMCHYTGKHLDGTIFDSSLERNEPLEFYLTQMIDGWVQALQIMQVGSKWILYIPANLAYGEAGAGDQIEPNETLIFEVELLKIIE